MALTILPTLAQQIFGLKSKKQWLTALFALGLIGGSIWLLFTPFNIIGWVGIVVGIVSLVELALKSANNQPIIILFDVFKNIIYAIVICACFSYLDAVRRFKKASLLTSFCIYYYYGITRVLLFNHSLL
ncbi:MAG: hypothetical protein R2728_08200 [Chitinophagales bacterium]